VLRLATAGGTALLTGDVEARGERAMIAALGPRLRADVLLVPHHGSKTSSTPGFLEAVAPTQAVVSVGYRNRFRHPNPGVWARYLARGIVPRRTDREGALRVVLPEAGWPRVEALERGAHYWRDGATR
jgi:competence protein ComEC